MAASPLFADVQVHTIFWNEREFSTVLNFSRAGGFRYGMGTFAIQCVDREYNLWLAMLPSTSLSEVQVRWQVDGGDIQAESWEIAHVYEVGSGFDATPPNPAALYRQLQGGEQFTIEVPQLNVGPAHFDLEAMWSTPVLENFDRCEDSEHEPIEFERPEYEPVFDLEGQHGEAIEYSAVEVRNGSVVTTVGQAPVYDGIPFQFEIGCNTSGAVTALLMFPADWEISGTGAVEVSLSVDDTSQATEQWHGLTLADGFQLRSESSFALVQALARSQTLVVSVPELEIWNARFDLPPIFSTPVQQNLNHCGY